jgi:HSP20 family protein
MTLVKYKNPTRTFMPSLFSDFDSVFDSWFNTPLTSWGNENYGKVNVVENDNNYVMEVALPGISRDNVEINVEENALNVSVKSEVKKETEDKNYIRKEFSYSNFNRSFELPENTDVEKIGAEFKDGILHITIDKMAVLQKEAKKIEIK